MGAPHTTCAWPFDVLTCAGSEKGGEGIAAHQGAIGLDLLIGWKSGGTDERTAAIVVTQPDLAVHRNHIMRDFGITCDACALYSCAQYASTSCSRMRRASYNAMKRRIRSRSARLSSAVVDFKTFLLSGSSTSVMAGVFACRHL